VSYQILQGDCIETMRGLPDGCVQTCVTSPPYYGLRDYSTATWEGGSVECDHKLNTDNTTSAATSTLGGSKRNIGNALAGFRGTCGKCGARRIDNQIGLEETPDAYVAKLVDVFREVRRLLRDDGTLWLNLGDSYNGSGGAGGDYGVGGLKEGQPKYPGRNIAALKPKDLIGIPWLVAFALRNDGWYLRSDIIWHKPNPMPESVTDRPTKSHEYIFLLSKSREYFYDADAIKEKSVDPQGSAKRYEAAFFVGPKHEAGGYSPNGAKHTAGIKEFDGTRNKRSVWTVTTKPYAEAHFATFPPDLIEPCILAGSKVGDTVLDPFNGSGTTGAVSLKHGRHYIGLELNPEYIELAHRRITQMQPMLLGVA
jgi:DNA modification methylase